MESSKKLCNEGRNQRNVESEPGDTLSITNHEHSCHEPPRIFDRLIHGSSECMVEIPDQSVHLTVTSPPYNVGKEYERGQTFEDWLELMRRVFTEVKRVTCAGGRLCIVVANVGRQPYVPLQHYLTGIMLDLGGFLMRGTVIWSKGPSAGVSSAWGSWKSASNPCLRDTNEFVLIFSKDHMKRERTGDDSISRDEFLTASKSVWGDIQTESARRIGHPSPFPVALASRLIHFYSFRNDLVLDPFMGSGSTAVAAVLSGRHYVGYDIIESYCHLARKRVKQAMDSISIGNGDEGLESNTAFLSSCIHS